MSEKNPKNLYRKALEFGVKRLHKGLDYHQTDIIVKKTMMPRFQSNETIRNFLSYVNDVVVEQIDAVKVIRTYFNYTVDKNDKNIN